MISGGDMNNGDMQLHDNSESHDPNSPQLNRLASLQLHKALIQSHDKQWTNQVDVCINSMKCFVVV